MGTEQTNQSYINPLIAATTSGFVGAYAGFFFQATKKRKQSNQKLPSISEMGPRKWLRETFRGSFSYTACIVPTSVIQQMANEYCKRQNIANPYFPQWIATLFSGALGGIASTVVENVLLEQQMKNQKASQAIKTLCNESSTRIFRGGTLIMVREAVFGYCYLTGSKQAGDYAKKTLGASYAVPAEITVGVVGSIVTHPFDTMATTMQQHGYTKVSQAAKHLLSQENAIKAFYKGGLARVGLFTTTMIVIGETQRTIMDRLEAHPPIAKTISVG